MTTVTSLTLRPYQLRCENLAFEQLRVGRNRPLIVMPTGAGKRIVAVDLCLKTVRHERDALIVTDRRLLVQQMGEELTAAGVDYGMIMDGYPENRVPRVQLASIQSLDSRCLRRDPLTLPTADVVIIDECHKSVEKYMALLAHYPAAKVFAFSATPVGAKGRSLIHDGYADCLIEGVTNSELIDLGYLLPTRVIAPSEPDVDGVRIVRQEEYAQGPLSRRIAEVTTFGHLWDAWAPFADLKTIVFAPGVAYCHGLKGGPGIPGESFYTWGVKAEVISAKVKQTERDRILEEFEHGDLRVLISVDVLREGFDCPRACCAIDLQPNAQFRTYWQKIGRIKRPFPGQTAAVYIDMAGNYYRFPHPDDDPDWSAITGDRTTQDWIAATLESGRAMRQIRCPKCAAVRKSGPLCHECGFEAEPSKIIRRIRMGNGKMREIPAAEKNRYEKTANDRRRDNWKSSLFLGLKCGKTLKQCAWIHNRKHGEWPGRDLPCVPEAGSAAWALRVDQIYSSKDIMTKFARSTEDNSNE